MEMIPIFRAMACMALLCSPAHAAFGWAFGGVSTQVARVGAGVQILPIPFVGSVGIEGSVEQPWNQNPTQTQWSAAAHLRDVHIPLTEVDVFAGVGGQRGASGINPFAEAGLRTPLSSVVGALGLRFSSRLYADHDIHFGLDVELRL